jgi:hypothetical protein
MPSRAEIRVRVEQVLRGIVIVALAALLWQSLHEQSNAGARTVSARGIRPSALADWSALAKAPVTIHLELDSLPSRIERAWLRALAGAGSAVMWSGDVAPVMIDAQPVASPSGGTKVLVASRTGSAVVVSDDVGPIDTLRVENAGATIKLTFTPDHLAARVPGVVASTVPRDSVALRRVLVIGNAGWESKFVIAALEEEGWKVDAALRVAPGIDVTQGSVAVIDTSRYSAVIALDASASPHASRIVEFARMGGGVVLSPQAALLGGMASLRAGTVGRIPSEVRPIQPDKSTGLSLLALSPITLLRSDAFPLEKRAGIVAIATRRSGAGRVLQMGYEDTWKWRMSGNADAVRDHRLWWTGLVGSVAFAPSIQRAGDATWMDEAPTAALVGAIGTSTPTAALPILSGNSGDWIVWLFLLLILSLVAEIGSRRLRGGS